MFFALSRVLRYAPVLCSLLGAPLYPCYLLAVAPLCPYVFFALSRVHRCAVPLFFTRGLSTLRLCRTVYEKLETAEGKYRLHHPWLITLGPGSETRTCKIAIAHCF